MQQPQPQPQHHGEKQYWEHLHLQVLNRVQVTPHTLALSWLPSGSGGGSQRHLLLPLAGLTHVACASGTIAWHQKLRGIGLMDRLRRYPALAVVSALLAVASLALWLAAAGKREAKLAPAIAAVQALLLLIAAAGALRQPCAANTEGKKRSRCATALIVLRLLFVLAAAVCAFVLTARAAPCREAGSSEMPGFFCQSPANATTTTTTTTTGAKTTTGTTPTAPASTASTPAAKATNAAQAQVEEKSLCGLALCDEDMQPVLFALFACLILQAAVCVALCFHAVVVFILARKLNGVISVSAAQIAAEESVCVSFYGSLSGYDWRGLHVTLSASAVPELTAALDAYRFAFVPKAR